MKRHLSLFTFTIWGLLSLWIVFGCLELAEAMNLIQETVTEDQAHQDFDEDALLQLASGLKSDVPRYDLSCLAGVTAAPPTPTICLRINTVHQFTWRTSHGPPSLPLYQQFSVYRI